MNFLERAEDAKTQVQDQKVMKVQVSDVREPNLTC